MMFEKFRVEGTRARARLHGTTGLPGGRDKTRGAETLSAAAVAQLRAAREKQQRALRARARAREAKSQRKTGMGGRAQLRARSIRSQDLTFCVVFIK